MKSTSVLAIALWVMWASDALSQTPPSPKPAPVVVATGIATATPLCNIKVTPPKNLRIAAIRGANHLQRQVSRFIIEYNDDQGNPAGAFEPDFVPGYVKLRVKKSSLEPIVDDYPLYTAKAAPVALDNVVSISIVPLFAKDGALFCMREIATIPHDAIGKDAENNLTTKLRILFFSEYGAPLNSTLIVYFASRP